MSHKIYLRSLKNQIDFLKKHDKLQYNQAEKDLLRLMHKTGGRIVKVRKKKNIYIAMPSVGREYKI